jgi:excisionase family DNA binding protein
MKMLDKKQAAEYLGVTTRTLERHAKEGKLSVRYENSQFGEVALFDPEELEALKEGKQTTRIKPAVESVIAESRTTVREPDRSDQPATKPPQNQIVRTPQTQLELLNPQQPESTFGIAAFIAPLGALFNNLTRAIDNHGSRVTATELRSKLLLTLDEAQIITGLSRDLLQEAIKNGELPSKIMGKAYRIKTQDLERYIENLEF